MKPMQRVQFGNFEAVEIPGQPGGQTVLMLHGYGADAMDLAPLGQMLRSTPGTRWIFLDGPFQIPLGLGQMGRAWFEIPASRLQQMMMGQPMSFEDLNPPGMTEMAAQIQETLSREKVDPGKLILAGFSQGAMIATELAMHLSVSPLGLCLLSSTCVNRPVWAREAKARVGQKYFQSHGVSDPVLPIEGARKLDRLLQDAGWVGGLVEFEGGHEIPQYILESLGEFLISL